MEVFVGSQGSQSKVVQQSVPVKESARERQCSETSAFNLCGEGLHTAIASVPAMFYVIPPSTDKANVSVGISNAQNKAIEAKRHDGFGIICFEYVASDFQFPLEIEITLQGQLLGKRTIQVGLFSWAVVDEGRGG